MARIALFQPNEAMARIAPRNPMAPNKYHSIKAKQVLLTRFEVILEGSNRFEKKIGLKSWSTLLVTESES
jgi:hypothetical protein